MVDKRVGVRLVAENGERVKAELDGIGESGERAFGRIEARSQATGRAVMLAMAAVAAAAAVAAGAMIRSGLQTIDSQAKLAQSLGTTVASIQTLERAGELAGVSMSGIEQSTKDLTRRLSQAAAGGGPAAQALERLGLSASDLLALPLDERVGAINAAIGDFVPAAERAAVAGQLFGEEGSIAMSRIDTATLRQATQDVRDFGVVVSEQDAAQIERTNDALSRLGLIARGVSNQLAVAAAPALEAVADAMAAVASRSGPLGQAIELVFDNLGRLASYATAFAAFMARRWVAAFVAARVATFSLSGALTVLRGALIRTGIGALIVAAGELIYWFGRLVSATGGFGNALVLLGEVAAGVWDGIVTAAKAIPVGLQSVWASVRAGFFRLVEGLAGIWAGFLHSIAGSMRDVPGLGDAMLEVHGAAVRAGSRVYEFGAAADAAAAEAAGLREEAGRLVTEGFDKARDAVARLAEVVTQSGEESEGALEGTQEAADGVTDALNKAGGAGKAAGTAIREGAEEVATGWDATLETLQEYVGSARDIGADVGGTLVGAFKGAEDAVVEFVRKGKLSFSDMITSFIADLARLAVRRFILEPIADALGGVLGGGGLGNFFSGLVRPSFEGGGHTGHGARVGGLDGKGGYLAMVHPRERVIDEARGEVRAGGWEAQPVVVNIQARDAESFRQSRTQVAADIQRAVAMGRRGM